MRHYDSLALALRVLDIRLERARARNPIGRVSRPRFLEIQREVARAMGVQLIYATGVNDHEALRVLPNVVRLRNERVDRQRLHRLVELDPGGALEAVRVGRREDAGPQSRPPDESR